MRLARRLGRRLRLGKLRGFALGRQTRCSASRVSRASPSRLSPTGARAASARIVRHLEQRGAARQVPPRHIGIIAEHRRADDDHQIVAFELLAQGADGRGQGAGILRVCLGKGRPLGEGRRPHRARQVFGEGDARLPALASGDVRAVDQDGTVRPVDDGGEFGDARRIGRDALADGAWRKSSA